MHQAHEAMIWGSGTQDVHGEHLVVDRDVGVFEHRGDFILTWRHFIVSGHRRNTQFHELAFNVIHVGQHALGDGAEVVVVKLMAFGTVRPKQGATAEPQVFAVFNKAFVDQEIFLFAAQSGVHSAHTFVGSEDFQDPHGLGTDGFNRAEERGFEVQSFSGVGDKDGGNAKRAATTPREDERGAGRVPSGVAPGFEGLSGPARGKGRSIGLTEGQIVTSKAGSSRAVSKWVQEGVVLLSG